MKKFLSFVLTALGLPSANKTAAVQTTVKIGAIRFSMPTVAADELELGLPTAESFEGAPHFHEDEWRQLEFLPLSRLDEVQQKLREYKKFERIHRRALGWTKIYARRLESSDVVSGGDAIAQITRATAAERLPAPILTLTSRPLGQVKGGFTLALPDSLLLYGLCGETGIGVLAAIAARGGDDRHITNAFVTLNQAYKLVLVDWRSQMVLVAVLPSGLINVWHP
jgi:hypothetical protein